mmetsp:Transcript_18263/g.53372  ORF Transcript_18263/g.53372 Transcript_18263/m.53372 type:complete len:175 (-) Transcript_18263:223-747(-)
MAELRAHLRLAELEAHEAAALRRVKEHQRTVQRKAGLEFHSAMKKSLDRQQRQAERKRAMVEREEDAAIRALIALVEKSCKAHAEVEKVEQVKQRRSVQEQMLRNRRAFGELEPSPRNRPPGTPKAMLRRQRHPPHQKVRPTSFDADASQPRQAAASPFPWLAGAPRGGFAWPV